MWSVIRRNNVRTIFNTIVMIKFCKYHEKLADEIFTARSVDCDKESYQPIMRVSPAKCQFCNARSPVYMSSMQ